MSQFQMNCIEVCPEIDATKSPSAYSMPVTLNTSLEGRKDREELTNFECRHRVNQHLPDRSHGVSEGFQNGDGHKLNVAIIVQPMSRFVNDPSTSKTHKITKRKTVRLSQ